jgi:endonuclease/exonuclease/phosphatase family metal-dependent hydrolase
VKVVSTHLDWNQGENGAPYRAIQIQELIEAFKNDKYVIMCADWNVGKTDEYDAFFKAGYDMANHGYLGDILTYPAGSKLRSYLDNIITKGFAISNVKVINDAMLSDHCLIKADLTKLP